jgi:hypothetical protein
MPHANGCLSNDMAAEALEVSKSSVDRAKRVLMSGDQDLIDAVEQGRNTPFPARLGPMIANIF